MKRLVTFLLLAFALDLVSGCASLSQQAFGKKFPIAESATGDETAQINFSSDKKYETPEGTPLAGDPIVCKREGIFRVNDGSSENSQVSVRAGEELAVTSVIQWLNTGIRKTCWPFVAFTPEAGSKYVIVNERIGGKGVSMLWTGAAFQTCKVSVYKEMSTGFEPVETRKPSNACASK